jgi:hypothetical protein
VIIQIGEAKGSPKKKTTHVIGKTSDISIADENK